jgi:glycosyltransferase involved in cell wall biosynthesis
MIHPLLHTIGLVGLQSGCLALLKIALYHNLSSGGGKRALYEMVSRLAARHRIELFTVSTANESFCDVRPFVSHTETVPFKPVPELRSPLGRLNQVIRLLNLRRLDAAEQTLARKIDEARCDVLLTYQCQFRQSPAVLRLCKTPSVYILAEPPRWIYEPPIVRPGRLAAPHRVFLNRFDPLPGLHRRVEQQADIANTRAATLVLANSYYSRETILRIYNVGARTCYLGVDTEKFRPLGIEKDNLVVSVGMINPLKRFDTVIESLALIAASQRPRLVIVANSVDAAEHEFLGRLAERLGVLVEVKRLVSDQELVQLYNRAIATIYTPRLEPFGFVPLESMACGTPVIGVNEAGVRETVVDGVTGALVERDPAMIAGVLAGWLAHPDKARRLGQQGREHMEKHWTWEQSIMVLEQHLARVAAQPSSGA